MAENHYRVDWTPTAMQITTKGERIPAFVEAWSVIELATADDTQLGFNLIERIMAFNLIRSKNGK